MFFGVALNSWKNFDKPLDHCRPLENKKKSTIYVLHSLTITMHFKFFDRRKEDKTREEKILIKSGKAQG